MRLFIFILLLRFLLSCREGTGLMPQQEHPNQPVITSCTQNIQLNTPHKTIVTIQFTTTKSWTMVVGNTKTDVSWISMDHTSGEAGTVALAVEVTEPNPSSLYSREAYLKVISDTALRVILITQPPRDNTDIAVTDILLNKNDIKLTIGSYQILTARILPENATNQKITYTSSNPEVSTVGPNGVIRGMKNGKAIITVTTIDADKTAKCDVTVFATGNSGGQINDWNE